MSPARAEPMTSPVLVGRDDLLELADRRLAEARSGRGQVLFLSGEAGIGKTRLLGAIERRASLAGLSTARASAFPRDLEVTGGVFLDLGRSLEGDASRRAWSDIGRGIRERLVEDMTNDGGDAHRRRRLLVLDLADLLAALAESDPVLVSLEDLHWADDLTLEALGQLARRIDGRPLMATVTYRSDELYPRVPMRQWRARLLTQRLAEEMRLPRLDEQQTGVLVRTLLGDPAAAPQDLVAELHRRSDGVPLHVEELLGAMLAGGAGGQHRVVPDTLADAIRTRADRLSGRTRRLVEAAAVIGRSFDADLLAALVDRGGDEVDRGLAELQDRFFIVPGRQAGRYDFRHALIRDAIHERIGPRAKRRLHGRAAVLLVERGSDEASVAAHFEMAGATEEAHGWATRAAERASRLSSHREAAELYRRALRTMPSELEAAERARILAAYADEAAAGDDNAAAADAYAEARRLLLEAGDPVDAAALVPPLVAARHLLGASLAARTALLHAGLAELESADDPTAVAQVRVRILAGLSAAYMLDRRLDESIEHGVAARSLAQRTGDLEPELHASVTLGADYVFAGRMDEGWRLLEDAVAAARDARLEAEAARAYRMIGSSASVLVEYDRAETWLREGIEYAERVELWNHRHYMGAHLAHVAWATGDWAAAEALATEALADGRGGITTRITALHVLGYLAMGRGDTALADRRLGEAGEVAERMGELQRLSPALWGQAEAGLLHGRADAAIELCRVGRRASAEVGDAAYVFPYLVTGTRALLELGQPLEAERWVEEVGGMVRRRSIPGTLPAVAHAEGLLLLARGTTRAARLRIAEAGEAWGARRRRWEECWALLDLARAEARSNRRSQAAAAAERAIALATALGATPIVDRAEELLRALRSAGEATHPWAPLTAREFEVASLVAGGRTNAEIAAELGIAPKTVSAHVEHILDRLGATRRAEIAAWVGARASGTSTR